MIRVKRVYEPAAPDDGARFLVERLWPRGVKKEALPLDGWLRDVAPSTALRQWFGHDPSRWEEFPRRYAAELDTRPEAWLPLLAAAPRAPLPLVHSRGGQEHNNAGARHRSLGAEGGH